MDVTEEYENYNLQPNEIVVNIPLPGQPVSSKGIIGVLAVPPAALHENISKSFPNCHHETPNIAILLHGLGGHKSYTFLKLTADDLAVKNGWYSFRFDNRGDGDSADDDRPEDDPRTILDLNEEDLDIVVRFWNDPNNYKHLLTRFFHNPQKLLVPNALIAHSRGVISMFRWSINQWRKYQASLNGQNEDYILIRNLVNVSGRYMGEHVIDYTTNKYGVGWENQKEGIRMVAYRNKKYKQKVFEPVRNIRAVSQHHYTGRWNLSILNNSKYYSVLTLFGTREQVVDLTDAYRYGQAMNKIHELILVKDADHNYYSLEPLTDANRALLNPKNLPTNSRGLVNYNYEVAEHISNWLLSNSTRSRFEKINRTVAELSRWQRIDGVNNFRDIGGFPLLDMSYLSTFTDGQSSGHRFYVRPNYIYRAADLSKISAMGLEKMRNLGISTVFDVRSDTEAAAHPFPTDLAKNKYGITYVHNPMFPQTDLSPESIFFRYESLLSSPLTIPDVYLDFLNTGRQCIRKIFDFIHAHPTQRFVFHCAAGKDRTGVIAMLILLAAGVDAETVSHEYGLTTTGLVPEMPVLRKHFEEQAAKFMRKFAAYKGNDTDNDEDITNKVNAYLGKGNPDFDIYKHGFANLISSHYETMLITIHKFHKVYPKGVCGYLNEQLGFTKNEISQIKHNLVTQSLINAILNPRPRL